MSFFLPAVSILVSFFRGLFTILMVKYFSGEQKQSLGGILRKSCFKYLSKFIIKHLIEGRDLYFWLDSGTGVFLRIFAKFLRAPVLTVCYYHVTYEFQSEFRLYFCLNVKELLAWSRCHIWSKRTQNHLAKRAKWFVYELSGFGFESCCCYLSTYFGEYLRK